jgi:hypothetical protein
LEIFKKSQEKDGLIKLFSQCNISFMAEKLLDGNPSIIETHEYDVCRIKKIFVNVLIILKSKGRNTQLNEGYGNLQNELNFHVKDEEKTCQRCKLKRKRITKKIQRSIRIETDWMTKTCLLSQIPTHLHIDNNR